MNHTQMKTGWFLVEFAYETHRAASYLSAAHEHDPAACFSVIVSLFKNLDGSHNSDCRSDGPAKL